MRSPKQRMNKLSWGAFRSAKIAEMLSVRGGYGPGGCPGFSLPGPPGAVCSVDCIDRGNCETLCPSDCFGSK